MRRSSGFLLLCFAAATPAATSLLHAQVRVASPDGRNQVTVEIRDGRLTYSLARDGRPLILPSLLGFEFRGAPPVARRASHHRHHPTVARRVVDPAVGRGGPGARPPQRAGGRGRGRPPPPAGSSSSGCAPSTTASASATSCPEQPGLGEFEISEELTEFALADNARAWWIPSNFARKDRSEMLYSSGPVSVLDSVQTPLTMQTQDGRTFMVIHEANLVDYARMGLRGDAQREPRAHGGAGAHGRRDQGARRGRPFVTPWRTIQLADKATGLAPSLLGLNLNPPNALASTDWIHPMKYVGIWWGMHIGTMTWSSGPKHGATTENTKRYIDFAAANGFGGVLVEGWNTGWDGDWIANRDAFSFTQAYPDYDLKAVAAYAKEKGVRLIVHNETSGGIENYERQLDSAFALYQSLGLDAIKSGYVTDLTSEGHSHYSQYMVRHYRRVIETAARARHHAGRPRADARHRRAPYLPQHDEPRGRPGSGVQRLERRRRQSARARDHPLLHPAAGRADGLHPGRSSTC